MFDWLNFLDSNGIEYLERGPNVAKGNVNIHCPFCGSRDPSQHLGVSVRGRGWYCFRDHNHRGKNPTRLVQALLGCSWERAEAVTGTRQATPLRDIRLQFQALGKREAKAEAPDLAAEFGEFARIRPSGPKPALRYLEGRGWPDPARIAEAYDLRYGTSGRWSRRIVLPVYCQGLRGWTGRALGKSDARYLSYPDDIKSYLFNYDKAARRGGRLLLIAEGPFDALRLDAWGRRYGARAVGTLGVNPTEVQIGLICRLAERFDETALVFDAEAAARSYSVVRQLRLVGAKKLELPPGVKDPDGLSRRQVRKIVAY